MNIREMAITGSRIMVQLYYSDEYDVTVREIFVWNWKTGELVRFRGLIDDT